MSDSSGNIQVSGNAIVVNFGGGEREDDCPAEGRYEVLVTRCEPRTSSKGNPMLTFALELVEGDHQGQWVWTNIVLVERTLWVLQNALEALTGTKPPRGEMTLDPNALLGKSCLVDLGRREWNGQLKPEVVGWHKFPAGAAQANPLIVQQPIEQDLPGEWDEPF